ncbi:hypothetical protein ACFL6S_16840 [Candidatus Poribacteria bacterium]
MAIIWTDYLKYRAKRRKFDLSKIENIIRYSPERYSDTATGRRIVVGKHDSILVMIAYEADEDSTTPVTIHAITRQQINFRIKTGRLANE